MARITTNKRYDCSSSRTFRNAERRKARQKMKLEEIKARMQEYQRKPENQLHSLLITHLAIAVLFFGLQIYVFYLGVKHNSWAYLIAWIIMVYCCIHFYLKADKVAKVRGGWF